jgi:hypothetical protein
MNSTSSVASTVSNCSLFILVLTADAAALATLDCVDDVKKSMNSGIDTVDPS